MPKGTLVIEVKCANCLSASLSMPDHLTNDPIVSCADCGHAVGPYSALKAALEGQAHTSILGALTEVTFKPIN
jgi:hypothetical protein